MPVPMDNTARFLHTTYPCPSIAWDSFSVCIATATLPISAFVTYHVPAFYVGWDFPLLCSACLKSLYYITYHLLPRTCLLLLPATCPPQLLPAYSVYHLFCCTHHYPQFCASTLQDAVLPGLNLILCLPCLEVCLAMPVLPI